MEKSEDAPMVHMRAIASDAEFCCTTTKVLRERRKIDPF
jgi:hypothetical protein